MYKTFIKTFLALPMIFLAGCGDENAFSASKDKIDESIYDQSQEIRQSSSSRNEENACYYGTSTHTDSWCCSNYGYRCYASSSSQNEANACYYGTSTHTDSWCCSNYGYRCYSYSSSSNYSSSSAAVSYLEDAKTMIFTLTYYYQLVKFDGNSTSDGDPEISFSVTFETMNGTTTTKSTGKLLDLSNQGFWSGTKSTTLAVPTGTYRIEICPKVIDEDAFSDDDYSSGYCYIQDKVGLLKSYESIEQTDYKSSNYKLEWEWYLY